MKKKHEYMNPKIIINSITYSLKPNYLIFFIIFPYFLHKILFIFSLFTLSPKKCFFLNSTISFDVFLNFGFDSKTASKKLSLIIYK